MNKLSRLIFLLALMLSVGMSVRAGTETYDFLDVSGTYVQSLGNEVTTSSGVTGMKTLDSFGELMLNNRFALNSGLLDATKNGGLSISAKNTDGTAVKNVTILSVLNLKAGDKVEVTLWSNNVNLYVTSGNVKYKYGGKEYALTTTGKIDENRLQGFTANADYTATFTMTADGTLDFYHGGSNATTRIRSVRIKTATVVPVKYNVTVVEPQNGTVAVDKTEALAGETVTVTAIPNADYELEGVSVKQGETDVAVSENNTFIMPEGDVTVSATFTKHVGAYNITIDDRIQNGTVVPNYYIADKDEVITLTVTPTFGYKLNTLTIRKDISVESDDVWKRRARLTLLGTRD